MMRHMLNIISLHDAQAECPCGWSYVHTGALTKEQIEEEWYKHLPDADEFYPPMFENSENTKP